MNDEKTMHYCPACFQPMVVDEYDKDVYYCFKKHYHGKSVCINLNSNKKRISDMDDNQLSFSE